MPDFSARFAIIYKKFADWAAGNGFRPSKLAFSRFIGISQGGMQKWEMGQVPTAKDLKAIHDKLGFAYDWLIAGEGEMFDSPEAAARVVTSPAGVASPQEPED